MIGEISAAPDITTFDDGERLVDLRLRVKMDISDIAAVFVGYHGLRIETTRGRSLDKRLQIGVSLGF